MIDRKELDKLINRLDNGIDKFIVAGLFYGLNGGSTKKEQLLNIKVDDVDFEKSTITLSEDRVVVMDDFLKKITKEAIEQKIYVKMGSQGRTNEDYYFNLKSNYIIKVKPNTRNNNGVEPLSNAGFKSRIRAISEFLTGDASKITPSELKKSGVYELLKSQEKKMTIVEAESLLKESGLSIRRNNLIPMLKEINEIVANINLK